MGSANPTHQVHAVPTSQHVSRLSPRSAKHAASQRLAVLSIASKALAESNEETGSQLSGGRWYFIHTHTLPHAHEKLLLFQAAWGDLVGFLSGPHAFAKKR
eukprot:1142675-Pelagomonas_calceolata.AAC.5